MSIELTNQAREDEAISDHIETLILLAVMDYRRSSVHLTRQSGGERTFKGTGLKSSARAPAWNGLKGGVRNRRKHFKPLQDFDRQR